MYYSESMIQMVEDLHRQASEMEKEVKGMMELEGRALGIELDKTFISLTQERLADVLEDLSNRLL